MSDVSENVKDGGFFLDNLKEGCCVCSASFFCRLWKYM